MKKRTRKRFVSTAPKDSPIITFEGYIEEIPEEEWQRRKEELIVKTDMVTAHDYGDVDAIYNAFAEYFVFMKHEQYIDARVVGNLGMVINKFYDTLINDQEYNDSFYNMLFDLRGIISRCWSEWLEDFQIGDKEKFTQNYRKWVREIPKKEKEDIESWEEILKDHAELNKRVKDCNKQI